MASKRPHFWFGASSSWQARALSPLAALYGTVAQRRLGRAPRYRPFVTAISIGNIVAGGQGKTPLALSIGEAVRHRGYRPVFLLRGYGGRLRGPHRVDAMRDDWENVGDEALMIARRSGSDTWIARDRAAAARLIDAEARRRSDTVLILDDAHQNSALALDWRCVVIDGADGFGNGRLLPAGPLREYPQPGLRRADAVVLFGDDRSNVAAALPNALPLLRAALSPVRPAGLTAGQRVIGFAGIGRPGKFRESLETLGLDIQGFYGFPDHHRYSGAELDRLQSAAGQARAQLVTTEKDAVRLPERLRRLTIVIPVCVTWQSEAALAALLDPLFPGRHDPPTPL